jgi:thymidine kinase
MSLEVYTGSMMSGKTTKMTKRVTKFVDACGSKAIIINHKKDTRAPETKVSSHSSSYRGLSDKIVVISAEKLGDVDVNGYEVVGIDEAFLFDDLFDTVKLWIGIDKNIIVAGLDGDFKMEEFGQIHRLLPLADKFVKYAAICTLCLEDLVQKGERITPSNITPAPFTKRLGDNKEVEDIGGADKYVAVCRRHHPYNKNL